ncbi:MAG: hypothetical protein J5666_00935 [Bacilli bacterium]|nr:hypothetical protein [Bacilli bacterium]
METVFFCAMLAVIMLITGIFLIIFGNKTKEDGKKDLVKIIIGWILFAVSILTLIVSFLVYIYLAGGITAAYLFIFLSPLFILAGFIIMLAIGISSLVEGFRRNKEGKRDPSAMIRGWTLLFLSIAMVSVIITTLAILFNDYSNSRGDTPVAFM